MKSLWLQIKQADATQGHIRLFDVAFPPEESVPLKEAPFSLALLSEPAWAALERQMASNPPGQDAFDKYGNALYDLLDKEVMRDWENARDSARTYLEVIDAPGAALPLSRLPWEYLARIDAGGGVDRFFAQSTPLLRALRPTGPGPIPLVGQLSALVVTGEPIDWENPGFPGDDVGAVLRQFQQAETFAYAELLETPTIEQLKNALERLNPDILHFTGHGELNPRGGKPALRIAPRGKPADWWDTAAIWSIFSKRPRKPRLVVLNTCNGAVARGELYSLLEMFIACGVPAAIASQAPILQAVTPALSQVFYRTLLGGEPADVAMSKARSVIGEAENEKGWQSRDWGLPVLAVTTTPELLFARDPSPPPDPIIILKQCAFLKGYMTQNTLPAPFAGLGWADQRWKTLQGIRNANCVVVRGPQQGGKSSLVKRTLRDAVHYGHHVKYVAVCGDKGAEVRYIDILSAIVEEDPSQPASHAHRALDEDAFQEFKRERDAGSPPQKIVDAFERGLALAAKNHEITIVLDKFQRNGNVSESFAAAEFKANLFPIVLKIATGNIKNLRLILVVRDELFDAYGLANLPVEPIQLGDFDAIDAAKLFQEICRFHHTPLIKDLQSVFTSLAKPTWRGGLIGDFEKLLKKLPAVQP